MHTPLENVKGREKDEKIPVMEKNLRKVPSKEEEHWNGGFRSNLRKETGKQMGHENY